VQSRVHEINVNFTGNWKADLSKGKFLGPPPAALTARIKHSEPELRLEMLVTKEDGSEDRVLFQCWTNGEQGRSLLNGNAVRGSARWEGAELVMETWARFGEREMHFYDCWSLSPDSQTLTMEHRAGDLQGQIVVLDRP
jgi:hypothetical protein